MITDTLDRCHRYVNLSPRFAAAFEFLRKLPANQPAGRYEIDGDDCFALVQNYTTRSASLAAFESHQRYIDIQFIQAGAETMLWSSVAALPNVTQSYSPEKDVTFYAAPAPTQMTTINLRAGDFTIFFPEDGHAPGLECGRCGEVRKVVVKVRV
ncbi:MAG TPA: YhcH/YjgK/YiaL family protein [Verrucomicrobiae bacterium]|nr:YhcH/YjgK/YiaL family protein [Verrucomicrobiae bacterium]